MACVDCVDSVPYEVLGAQENDWSFAAYMFKTFKNEVDGPTYVYLMNK